jgi:predicted Holliday junction resolvase-like endonuclease
MDVLIIPALIGLFVFLGFLYKQNLTSKAEFDQLVKINIDLEHQLQSVQARAAQTEALQAELSGYRQATQTMVSSSEYEMKKAENMVLKAVLDKTKEELDTLKGKQISERVRLGQVSENVLPFLSTFPYDPKRVRGLFQPIDLLVFNDDEIVFVEVKTGDAKLTEKQRNIKRIIEEGKVRFEVHMMKDTGYEIK